MEEPGKFSRLRQRDVSVPMLRVKLSRRRSQSQKENRERAVNSRRQLDQVPELDSTLEASIMAVNISNVKVTAPRVGQSAKDSATAQRLEMLKRWKENKSLIKEKEKREKERKGVFKVGLFRPTDSVSLQLPVAKPCEAAVKVPQTRGTRLTKLDQQSNKPVVGRMTRSRTALVQPQPAQATTSAKVVQPSVQSARAKVQPVATRGNAVRAGPVAGAAIVSNVDKPAGGRTTRGNAKPVATSTGRGKNKAVVVKTVSAVVDETAAVKQGAESTRREEEAELVAESDTLAPRPATEGTSSFAPKGFVFETPAGLSTFKFEPLTPRSVDTFLRPSSVLNFPPVPLLEAETSGPSPPKSPHRSPQAPTSPQEPQHDVPYFRSQVTTETARLTTLSQLWEVKVDDDSIPEEMRDRMRTAVGQARLLMKERFGQFLGLVDDCELGRGEQPTSCNDLQGFWDMVYFQVEDVFRKFDALKEAEARCWVEENKPAENKPAPRRRKIGKKPPPAAAASKGVGTNAEAKSRLAAVKAAMKAKQQAAEVEKAAQAAVTEDYPSIEVSEAPTATQVTDTVVFNGGFFKVESPAKTGSLSCLSTAKTPQASPCGRVPRQSIAMSNLSPLNHSSPDHRSRTPARHALTLPHTPCTRSEQSPVTEAASSLESAYLSVQDGEEKPEIGSQPLSPRLSPAPSIPTSPSSQSPDADLSFSVSPCPVVPSTPTVVPAHENYTPDSSVVEDGPGLDMARYLQPSDRCSLSARNFDSMETSLPVDVEMESPIALRGDERTQEDAPMPPTDLDQVLPPQFPQAAFEAQNAESDLLLFTPNLKDRIRQSVCPSDLMAFTPPN